MGDDQTPSMNPVDVLYRWAQESGPPGDPRRIPLIRAALDCVADVQFKGADLNLVETVRRYADGLASVDAVYEARHQIRSSLMCPALALGFMVYGVRPWAEVRWICYPRGHEHCAEVLARHTGLEITATVKAKQNGMGLVDVLLSVFNVKPTPNPRQTALVPTGSRGTP
jgi:hypothetical protein